jgi:hypothetical protein
MNNVHYLQGNNFESRREELFNRIVSLSNKINTLKGIVQNPLPDKISKFNNESWDYVTSETFSIADNIKQWNSDLAIFLTDFYNEHKG